MVRCNVISLLGLSFFATITHAAEFLVPQQFATIQEAVDAASDGDEIVISPGTYISSKINVKGSNLTFRSIDPTNKDVRDATIIASTANVFDFTVYPVSGVFNIKGLLLNGLSFTTGGGINGTKLVEINIDNCFFDNCAVVNKGGAIYNAKGTIKNSFFDDCSAGASGSNFEFTLGGAISDFDGLIENCDFLKCESSGIRNQQNQRVEGYGGALGNVTGTIKNCRFIGNRASGRGGAIAGLGAEVIDCFFDGNTATIWGGAIYSAGSGAFINRCIFVNHRATASCVLSSCNADVINSIFANNSVVGAGGVSAVTSGLIYNNIYFGNNADLKGSTITGHSGPIVNCIFWSNTSGDNSLFLNNFQYPQNSIIQNTQPDDRGNFGADPLFIDPTFDANNMPRNFRLQPLSPAIDRGLRTFDTGTSTTIALQTDADGLPRPVVNYPTIIFNRGDGFGTDIGAYEHQTVYEEYPESGELWTLN